MGSQGGYGETGARHGTGAQNSQKENTWPIVPNNFKQSSDLLQQEEGMKVDYPEGGFN